MDKDLAKALKIDYPEFADLPDEQVVEAYYVDNPEARPKDTVKEPTRTFKFKDMVTALANVPENTKNIIKGASEGVGASTDILTGKAFIDMFTGKKPRFVEQAEGFPEALEGIGQRLTGLVQGAGIPLPIGDPNKNIERVISEPVSTALDVLPVVGGVKSLIGAKKPIVTKPVTKGTGLPTNLRAPAEFAKSVSGDYGKTIKNIYSEFKNSIGDIEKNNPNKTVDIGDIALEWATDSDVLLPKKLLNIAEGKSGSKVTLSELQDIKNQITGKLSEKKLGGEYRSPDVARMELITDINKAILGGFEEMKPVYNKFADRINMAKSIKQLRKPEGALEFIKNASNDVKLENAAKTLSPEMVKAIRRYRFVSNIGVPKTNLKVGEILKRDPLKQTSSKGH